MITDKGKFTKRCGLQIIVSICHSDGICGVEVTCTKM